MDGLGIIKGMSVTLRRFVDTYLEDLRWWGKRYYTKEGIAQRRSTKTRGIFTVQYPEEKLPVPEEFRYVPFLLYEEGANGEVTERCTSCGICAKVCPPQCIWIVRAKSPEGKPLTRCSEFYIDMDVCMNCGFCAEFCPFDAIKMDHDYELADYERHVSHIYDYNKLMKSTTYYENIRPHDYAYEEANLTKERQASKAKKVAAATAAAGATPATGEPKAG